MSSSSSVCVEAETSLDPREMGCLITSGCMTRVIAVPVPTPVVPVPTLAVPVPTSAVPVPTLAVPMPTPVVPVPTPVVPVPTLAAGGFFFLGLDPTGRTCPFLRACL